jgi:hypothetical protein
VTIKEGGGDVAHSEPLIEVVGSWSKSNEIGLAYNEKKAFLLQRSLFFTTTALLTTPSFLAKKLSRLNQQAQPQHSFYLLPPLLPYHSFR